MYKIDKNVAIPEEALNRKGGGRNNNKKYPFADMTVNDSFYVPNRDRIKTMTASMARYKKNNPTKTFVWAHEGDGIRVWRVA